MRARAVTECDICGGTLRSVLNLGSSPPTCHMQSTSMRRIEETHYPLELLYCDACTLAQLSVVVDPDEVFPPDYPYSSGNSKALHENFEDLADQATEWVGLGSDDLVVDIGANDGTLLSKFPESCQKVGVEPTDQGAAMGVDWWKRRFTEDAAREICQRLGPAKVITACNVLAHVEDIHDVMRGIDVLLADDGILVAENHDLKSVVDGQWDTVYHEHLRFFSPYSFSQLLKSYGLALESWKLIPTHGGSFRMVSREVDVEPGTFPGPGFLVAPGARALPIRQGYDFDRLVREASEVRGALRLHTDAVCGIGATARATTIINYCGLDIEDVEYVCEVSGSDKIGRYIPGTRIPVVDEARLFEDQKPAVLFSWHMADRIIPKLREQGYHGDIIVPLPSLQVDRVAVAA